MSKWDKKISQAEKFLQAAHAHGKRVYARYEDKTEETTLEHAKKANLFFANVQTIKDSLYNSLPKPDVSKLHKGDYEDDPSRVAALAMQRALHYEVQCSEFFDPAVKAAILNRLVPGIGQVWVRFDVDMEDAPEEGVEYAEGDELPQAPVPGTEAIFIDTVYWEDFLWEPARSWEQVTWCGRRLLFTKDELIERWGEEAIADVPAPTRDDTLTSKEVLEGKYAVYEIWNKTNKTVLHIVKGREEPLDERPDPYKLKGFFPCPRPLIANPSTAEFLPVTDYHQSQDQYNQLDTLYARISLIIEAVKVAGCYDASETAIGNMLQGQENKLVPVDNWAMFMEKGGAKGMIDWYPVEQVVSVLAALQAQYEAVKGVLQEVSGMADIQRGETNQYETAKAQEIKAAFASVRMNGYQRDVAEFVRDILRIMSGIMMELYSDEKMMSIIGTMGEADRALLPAASQILRDTKLRQYKIDIESDSLTQADWALEKGQRVELVQYISTYLGQAVPAIQQDPGLGPILMGMMKFAISGFKGAQEIEGLIDQQIQVMEQKIKAAEGKPKPPSAEEQKMQLEQQKAASQAQLEQQKMQMQGQLKELESQSKARIEILQAKADMTTAEQKAVLEGQIMRLKMEQDGRIAALDLQMKEKEMQFKEREALLKLEVAKYTARQKMQQSQQQHEQSMQQQKEMENAKPKTSGKE